MPKMVELQIGEMRMTGPGGRAVKTPQFRVTAKMRGCDLEWWLTSPVCQGARKLIEAGVSGDVTLRVTRNGMKVFEDRPLSAWADETTTEGTDRSVRFVKFSPFTGLKDE